MDKVHRAIDWVNYPCGVICEYELQAYKNNQSFLNVLMSKIPYIQLYKFKSSNLNNVTKLLQKLIDL